MAAAAMRGDGSRPKTGRSAPKTTGQRRARPRPESATLRKSLRVSEAYRGTRGGLGPRADPTAVE